MAVYVDPLMGCLQNRNWRANESCHLFADTLDELHEFARSIGLLRDWFQDSHLLPHYDLTRGKRLQALRAGARPVKHAAMVGFMRRNYRRSQGQEGDADAKTNAPPRSLSRAARRS